jgi:hypothetical protein
MLENPNSGFLSGDHESATKYSAGGQLQYLPFTSSLYIRDMRMSNKDFPAAKKQQKAQIFR